MDNQEKTLQEIYNDAYEMGYYGSYFNSPYKKQDEIEVWNLGMSDGRNAKKKIDDFIWFLRSL